jgi:hypothetical protein
MNGEWKERFHLLERNAQISAIGKIVRIFYTEVEMDSCELVDRSLSDTI